MRRAVALRWPPHLYRFFIFRVYISQICIITVIMFIDIYKDIFLICVRKARCRETDPSYESVIVEHQLIRQGQVLSVLDAWKPCRVP